MELNLLGIPILTNLAFQGKKCVSTKKRNSVSTIMEKNNGQTAQNGKQAMYNQFKRPSAGSVREFYYIYRKSLRFRILGLMSHVTIITWMAT